MKSDKQTYIVVRDRDLEEELEAVFGREFSFAADQEMGNDAEKIFHVRGTVDQFDQARIEALVNEGQHGHGFLTQALLDELCKRGRIEAGEYLIRIAY